MDELIISVAPVPGEMQKEKFPGVLNTVDETIRSWNAGASLVHLHVRDPELVQTSDTQWFEHDIGMIREATDIIIEGSTGGSSQHTLADRSKSINVPGIEMGTLNLGSINMYDGVYCNPMSDIVFYAGIMKENAVKPCLLCFDLSHYFVRERLETEGLLDVSANHTYAFCMNVPNGMPYSDEILDIFVSRLPENSVWFLILYHALGVRSFHHALELGGHVRVGFEDGPFVSDGSRSDSNARLVEDVVEYATAIGRRIASPRRSREIIGLPHDN